MKQKYLSLLGLAMRAKRCSLGTDQIIRDIQNRTAKLVLIANDCSERTQKRLMDKCHSYNIRAIIVDDIATLSRAIGEVNRVAVAILDKGFAKKIASLIDGN